MRTPGGGGATVVIVSHNEGSWLRATVDAMLETAPADTELVVVDDQSTDGSTEGLPGEVRVVHTTMRAGVARARNLGAAHASGDVIVFTDGHVEPSSGWLEPLAAELRDPCAGVVAPAVYPLDTCGRPGFGFTWRSPALDAAWLCSPVDCPTVVPMVCGCFLALRRDLFNQIGGFDGGLTLWGLEDAELSLNLWRRGFDCRVIPDSRIDHLFRQTFPYALGRDVLLRNVMRVAVVHFDGPALTRVMAHHHGDAELPGCVEATVLSDAMARRARLNEVATRSIGDFFGRFGIEALR